VTLTCGFVVHANDGGHGKGCQQQFLVWQQGDLHGGKSEMLSEG